MEFDLGLTRQFIRDGICRYGENPHQAGAIYGEDPDSIEPCITCTQQLSGKEMSFNNWYDANAALETVKEFVDAPDPYNGPAAVIVKHTNPCGAGLGETLLQAYQLAYAGDRTSAFGGVVAVNRPLDVLTVSEMTRANRFFEVIIAPQFEQGTVEILRGRSGWGENVRLLEVGDLIGWRAKASPLDYKPVVGGLLVQERDLRVVTADDFQVVTNRAPNAVEAEEMLFGYRVVKHLKSNAIVFTRGLSLVGMGAGQPNRVNSVKLAVEQAGEKAKAAVMASDAFFPFADGPEAAIDAGITAIIQPGGAKKDQETIDLCNKRGVAMVFTGIRHFLH